MFKRLKEKITEEVSKSPLRLQTVQTQIGQYSPFNGTAKKPSDSQGSSESDAPTQTDGQNLIDLQENCSSIMDVSESHQFSIADEDGASSATTSPIPQPQSQKFENVDLTANFSALAGPAGRPRTASVSSTGSQPSFFPIYSPMQSSYRIQSDLESTSEMEDSAINLDIVSKDQLYQAFLKAKSKYAKYKSQHGRLMKAYQEQVNETEKVKTILSESQDKALRRISELREQSQLEQKAKAHLEDSFRVTLEEKDELLRVLQTQVRLLKNGEEDPTEKPDDEAQNNLIDISSSDTVKSDDAGTSEESTQLKVKTYEETIVKLKSLLRNCKDTIDKHRAHNVRLAAEKDQLAEKLNEANAQLKNFVEEKSAKERDLLNELMQASQTIEDLKTKEAEDALNMAEAKRSMHEEMEGKEKKLQDLKVELQQLRADKEELQRSVNEKSKEVLEIKTKSKDEVQSAKQQLEEAEKMLEDEKQNLLQELSRGKAAAIQLMQQESDKRLMEMEDENRAALDSLEHEWQAKVQQKVKEEVENLVRQDALESTSTMSDHFTNQIATLKQEVQEKEAQLKHLVEEKTLFQEQIQEMCHLQKSANINPILAAKDSILEQFHDIRKGISMMKADIEKNVSESSGQFAEVKANIRNLWRAHERELRALMSANLRLTADNKNFANECACLHDDLYEVQQQRVGLEDQLAVLNTENENYRKEIERFQNDLQESQEKMAVMEDFVAISKIKNHNSAEETTRIQEAYGAGQQHISLLEYELADSKAALEQLQAQLVNGCKANEEMEVLNLRLEESEAEVTSLKSQLDEKDAEIAVLAAQKGEAGNSGELLEKLKAELQDKDSEISILKANWIDQLQNLHDELRLVKQNLKSELKELVDKRDAVADQFKSEIASLDEKLRLEVERNKTLEEMQVAPRSLAEWEHGTQLLEVNQQLEKEKNANENLTSEVDSLREQLRLNNAKNEKRISKLSREIEAKQHNLKALDALCKSKKRKIHQFEQENESAAMETVRQTCDILSVEKSNLSARVKQLEREKNDLSAKLVESLALLHKLEDEKLSARLAVEVAVKQQLEEFQNDVSEKMAEINALVKHLEEEKLGLSSNLAEEVALTKQLKEEKNDLNTRLAEMDAILYRLEEERLGLSSSLAEEATLSKQLKEDKNGLSARLEQLEVELAEQVALLRQIEEEKLSLSASLAEEAALTRQLIDEKDELNARLAEKEALVHQLEEEKLNLSSNLSEADELKKQLKALSASWEQLGEECNEARVKLAENIALLRQIEEEKFVLSTSLAEEAAITKQMKCEKNDLNAKLAEKEALVHQLEEEKLILSSNLSEADELKKQLKALSASSEQVGDECNEARAKLTENIALLRQIEEEKLSLNASLAEEAVLTKQLKDEKDELSARLAEKEALVHQLEEEKLILSSNLSEEDELKKQLKAVSASLEQLGEECNETRAKLAENVALLQQVEEEKLVLSASLAEETALTKQLKDEKNDLSAKLAEKEALVQQLESEKGESNALIAENLALLQRLDDECAAGKNSEENLVQVRFELESCQEELRLKTEFCNELSSKVNALEMAAAEYERKEAEAKLLVEVVSQLKEANSALETQCFALRKEHSDLDRTYREVKETNASHALKLGELEEKLGRAEAALNDTLAQKHISENELNEQVGQLQATLALKEEEGTKLETLMQEKLKRVTEENQSKLADLKKRAENKLAQIKKQVVYDADKSKGELQAKIASLEEQKRQDDEAFFEKLAKERENVQLEFQEKMAVMEKQLEELGIVLENERSKCSAEKENFNAELALKDSQIDESLLNAQLNHEDMSQMLSSLQAQLDQIETNLNAREIELAECRVQLAEKEELLRLHSEGESKTSLNEDNRLRREHVVHLSEIQNEFGEKELSFEMALEEKESIIQARTAELDKCNQAYEEKMDVMKTEHQRQMQELEKKWKAMLRKELKQQAAMHEEDVNGLTQEWQLERKLAPAIDYNSVAQIEVMQEELQQQTHLASSAIESGGQSSELLRRQIMTMQTQMEMLKDRHKAEVSELHQVLQASNCPVPSGKSVGRGIFRDRPALQSLEIEYLKNILFEYMMGRETLTLAKVIATVVQFSDEQLNKILEKEESRGGGVSGQLGQIWK